MRYWFGYATAATASLFGVLAAETTARAGDARSKDCFDELERGRGPTLTCAFPTRLTGQERQDLLRITRGTLKDADCIVTIRIERQIVDAALAAADHVFQAPPQPVQCNIVTANSAYPINATFAPRVVFKGDKAVEATPGLANVVGVSKFLAWPVVQYVNRSPGIRKSMMAIVDAYRERRRRSASAGR